MPELQELMDAISQALDDIENDLNEDTIKDDMFDVNIALIDQKWAMLKTLLIKRQAKEEVV